MDDREIAVKIVEALGGKSNIVKADNCMTRFRVTVREEAKVDEETLKATENVLGLVNLNGQFQIVLGPGKAKKIRDIAVSQYKLDTDGNSSDKRDYFNDWKQNKENIKSKQKDFFLNRVLKTISEIFVPLIPAIIASGLANGLASLMGILIGKDILPEGLAVLKLLFTIIGTSFTAYFAIFTGIRSAEVFGATPAMGGMIGGMSIVSALVELSKQLGLYNEAIPLESILTSGKGGIIGVILGVFLLARVEKFIRKRVPDLLDLILTPFLSLLITATVFVLILMPLAGFLSDYLVAALSYIVNSPSYLVRIISGFILSALFLPMVLLGLHHGLIPIYAVQLDKMGGVSLFPVLAMAGAGQVGAALAIYIIAKKVDNQRLEKVIAAALPAGLLGVGEPLIYGVTLPMFKPFITAGLGAGFGGAFVMLSGVMANAWGPSGLVALPLMQGWGVLYYLCGLVISYIGGFVITILTIKDEDVRRV